MILTQQNIQPIGDRLLIEPYKQASETTEGLIVSEGEGYAAPVIGTILKVGDKVTSYKVGEVVMMRRYSVDSLKVYSEDGEKEIYLLECSEVVARVSDGEPVEPPDEYHQIKEKIKLNQDAAISRSKVQEQEQKDSKESVRKER